MATFLTRNKHKPSSFIPLSRIERVIFVLITATLIFGAIYFVQNRSHQRDYINTLNQYQYDFNQACQLALNSGMDRDNSYCQAAEENNHKLTLALKDQKITLAEWVDLKLIYDERFADFRPEIDQH